MRQVGGYIVTYCYISPLLYDKLAVTLLDRDTLAPSYTTIPYTMKYNTGALSGDGQFTIILPSQGICNLAL
jgi:hypothetical protein